MADLISQIESEIKGLKFKAARLNVGKVTEVGDGVARIEGLSEVQYSELLDFGPSTLQHVQGRTEQSRSATGSGQTLFVNDYLVRDGYARVLTYPPDVKYNEQFREAEKEAKAQKKGLWGRC